MNFLNFDSLLDLISKNAEYMLVFIVIIIIYLFVRLFVGWIVKLNAVRLLSYFVSSLIIFLLLLSKRDFLQSIDKLSVKTTLHSLSLFGVVVFIIFLFTYVRKVSKRV